MNPVSKQEILAVLENSKLELSKIQFYDEAIVQIQEFCSILDKWNEKINLISEKNQHSILERHIFDSLQYLRWLDSSQKVLDIGSGAGFPGIPVKIICPNLNLTLLESQRKRCNFLREVVRALKLKGLEVVEGRSDDFSLQKSFSEQFDRVLFRGFSSFSACLATGLPFLKEGGRIILKKNPEEMSDFDPESLPNARIIESKEVQGLRGKSSLMVVIEKCST